MLDILPEAKLMITDIISDKLIYMYTFSKTASEWNQCPSNITIIYKHPYVEAPWNIISTYI